MSEALRIFSSGSLSISWEFIKIAARSLREQNVQLDPKITAKMYSYNLFFAGLLICFRSFAVYARHSTSERRAAFRIGSKQQQTVTKTERRMKNSQIDRLKR